MKIGFLYSLIRKDEKMLIDAFKARSIEPVMIDDRELVFKLNAKFDLDCIFERSISFSRGLETIRIFESLGFTTFTLVETELLSIDLAATA